MSSDYVPECERNVKEVIEGKKMKNICMTVDSTGDPTLEKRP